MIKYCDSGSDWSSVESTYSEDIRMLREWEGETEQKDEDFDLEEVDEPYDFSD